MKSPMMEKKKRGRLENLWGGAPNDELGQPPKEYHGDDGKKAGL